VLPAGDLGIVNAIPAGCIDCASVPMRKRILKMGDAWRPYRSVASWYLWQTASRTKAWNEDWKWFWGPGAKF